MQLDGALVVQLVDAGKRCGHGGGAFERARGIERRDAGGHEARELPVELGDANLLALVARKLGATVPPQGALGERRCGSGEGGAERDARDAGDMAGGKQAALPRLLLRIPVDLPCDRAGVHDAAVARADGLAHVHHAVSLQRLRVEAGRDLDGRPTEAVQVHFAPGMRVGRR